MSAPKVSVLIPAFNSELFLAACIESVLAQDFKDYELLIANDCSTDGTLAIIESYAAKNPRIRWWSNQKNLGQAANFNLCLQAARGELIKPIFADDVLLQTSALSQMTAVLAQQPAVSLVSCASYVIDEHARRLKFRDHFRYSKTWDGREIIVRCFENVGNIIGEPSLVMFRRSQASCGFNGRYRQIVDLEFFLHLLEQGQFSYIAEPLAAWRQHPNQVTAANRRSRLSAMEELWLIQEWFAKPWLQTSASRQMLFTQIHHLRKYYRIEGAKLAAEMMRQLGRGWFLAYWLKRKIARPFKRLLR